MRRWTEVLLMVGLASSSLLAGYALRPTLGLNRPGVTEQAPPSEAADGPAPDEALPDGGPDSASPLVAGEYALRRGWYVTAYRRCQSAEVEGAERAAALICQGRAALHLGWGSRAAYLAQRALEAGERASAYVLLGDAHRAQRDCRQARPIYLRALELDPGNRDALEGLQQCASDAPSPGDSSLRPELEEPGSHHV